MKLNCRTNNEGALAQHTADSLWLSVETFSFLSS